MPRKSDEQEATYDGFKNLDPLLQHRARLGICVLLSKTTVLSFARLKEFLEETDGNLGAQLRKLEDSDYLEVRKEFVNRKPTSWYSLTEGGKKALGAHLKAMAAIVEDSQ